MSAVVLVIALGIVLAGSAMCGQKPENRLWQDRRRFSGDRVARTEHDRDIDYEADYEHEHEHELLIGNRERI
jgi:hypothetical protein